MGTVRVWKRSNVPVRYFSLELIKPASSREKWGKITTSIKYLFSLLFSLDREWLLTKIVNGERASYSAPKFARMQERTRSQMLEDIVANLANHAETGQIPKPYRRGSWRPIGHMRPSSPLLDSVRDQFEGNKTNQLK